MKDTRPTAIVLGGTYPHKILLDKLKERGYYTILVDYYENPVAKADADEHIRESTLDRDVVLEIAKKQDAKLVIGTCVDKANVTACYVGEKLGLPIPYSYACARDISNKATMKACMIKEGIPTSKFISVKEGEAYNLGGVRFPLVVKPTDGNSSKGVYKVNDVQELERYLPEVFAIAKSKTVVIEEYVVGVEVSVNTFIANRKAHILYAMQRLLPSADYGSVLYGNLSITPPHISKAASDNIQAVAEHIAAVFGLENTPLLLQFIVNGDDVSVIEFAPRIGGGDNSIKIWHNNKFDMIEAAINSYLGIKIEPQYIVPKHMYTTYYVYTEPGIFGEIRNYEELIKNGTLSYLYPTKTRGMTITSGRESTNRLAYFLATGNTQEELFQKVQTALSTIEVMDINGHKLKILDNSLMLAKTEAECAAR